MFLGGIAGSTIFLGLPLGRMQSISPHGKSFLSAGATGILLFLLWDVLAARSSRSRVRSRAGTTVGFFGLAALLAGGFGVGLLSLGRYDGWLAPAPRPGDARARCSVDGRVQVERHVVTMSPSRWLALFIATGIGLHNFSEGLAIGQSAAADELSLALCSVSGSGSQRDGGLWHRRASRG